MIPHNVVGDKLLNLLLSEAATSKGRTQEGSPTRKSSKKLLPTLLQSNKATLLQTTSNPSRLSR